MNGDTLTAEFLARFAQDLALVDPEVLRAAWTSQTARTLFYGEVLGRVAGALDLDLERELLIVDFALVGKADRVPRIFVESENIASSADQEVRKLCCLASPLKILLSVCEWDETPSVWRRGSVRPQVLPAWRRAVAAHVNVGLLSGEIVAVVAEWRPDQRFRLYSVSLRDPSLKDVVLLSRDLGPARNAANHHTPVV